MIQRVSIPTPSARQQASRRAELDEELRDHLERDIANRVRHGADVNAARREALRLFGGVERWKDEAREARGTQLVGEAISDARHAVRRMYQSPGFAAVVVATLAIGVGASTTIFSVVDGVLLKPLPYREPERLVAVWQNNQLEGIEREEPSPANFLDWRARNGTFEAIAAAEPYSVSFQTPDGPERENLACLGGFLRDARNSAIVWPRVAAGGLHSGCDVGTRNRLWGLAAAIRQ